MDSDEASQASVTCSSKAWSVQVVCVRFNAKITRRHLPGSQTVKEGRQSPPEALARLLQAFAAQSVMLTSRTPWASSPSRPLRPVRFRTARRAWDMAAFCSDPLVSCIGWAALISGTTVLKFATMDEDHHTPRSFLKSKRKRVSRSAPIVCLGDSITRGNLSADWVSSLRSEWQEGLVLNAGVNMQCSQNIQMRVDARQHVRIHALPC